MHWLPMHWSENFVIFTNFSSLAVKEVVNFLCNKISSLWQHFHFSNTASMHDISCCILMSHVCIITFSYRGYPAKRALSAMRSMAGRALLAGYPRYMGSDVKLFQLVMYHLAVYNLRFKSDIIIISPMRAVQCHEVLIASWQGKLSALLKLNEGNPLVTIGLPLQRTINAELWYCVWYETEENRSMEYDSTKY